MTEKHFFLSIKDNLPKGTFIQKIENKFNFVDTDKILIDIQNQLLVKI